MSNLNSSTTISIKPGYRLQWEPRLEQHVVLFPEGMVKLNQTAFEILNVCDGANTLGSIIALLQQKFNQPNLEPNIREFLEVAYARGWVEFR
jgi:pyrroloquinoline quinone biosynthesis protein D